MKKTIKVKTHITTVVVAILYDDLTTGIEEIRINGKCSLAEAKCYIKDNDIFENMKAVSVMHIDYIPVIYEVNEKEFIEWSHEHAIRVM